MSCVHQRKALAQIKIREAVQICIDKHTIDTKNILEPYEHYLADNKTFVLDQLRFALRGIELSTLLKIQHDQLEKLETVITQNINDLTRS